jgi:PEP-CTERM motif-containing protein
MRFKTLAAILFLFFLSTAQAVSASSVAPKSKSNYGDSPYLTDVGSSETSGGATLQLVCAVSLTCPAPGESDLLEVSFPNGFTPGALFDVNGIDTTQEVDLVCDYSFIGACDGGTLTSAQQACVTSIGGSIISSSTYQLAIANCSSGSSGTFMTLIFGLSGDFTSIPTSVSVSPASATTPEPASWMLFALGAIALIIKRRAIAGTSIAS